MTDAELDHAEALFRNPQSASTDLDLCLRLVAEVRRLSGIPKVPIEAHQMVVIAPNVTIKSPDGLGAADEKPKRKAKGDTHG